MFNNLVKIGILMGKKTFLCFFLISKSTKLSKFSISFWVSQLIFLFIGKKEIN